MTDNNNYLLLLEDVYVRYVDHKGKEFTVLNDIDLKVSPGEFVTVVGPSGCGKSTLLRLILGSERPTMGRVLFDGKPIYFPYKDRGIVFQKYYLFPHLTVLQNLIYGLDAEEFSISKRVFHPFKHRLKREEYREQAAEYLKRVGLGKNDGDKFPQQLSGGMCQRVAIAQALSMNPKILLMDEPFGALDYSTRQDMQLFILEQWKKTKMTIFFVTHDLEEAVFLGTRTILLTQYYTTDREENEGAKIVTDIPIPGEHPKSTDFKYSSEMCTLMNKLKQEGLDPNLRQHITDFDLSHKDSFRTVTAEEWEWKDNNSLENYEAAMKIKWRFIRHGELPIMGDNELAVDIGSLTGYQELLFDHHSYEGEEFKCSASLLFEQKKKLEKLLDKEQVIVNCHSYPDTDCVTASFLAVCFLKDLKMPGNEEKEIRIIDNEPVMNQLLHIVSEIDQGKISPVSFETSAMDFNFYSFFLLLDDFIKSQKEKKNWTIVRDYISRFNLDLSWDSWEEQFMAYSFVFLKELVKNENPVDFLTILDNPSKKTLNVGSLDNFLESERLDEKMRTVFIEISGFIKEKLARGRTELLNMFERGDYEFFNVKTTSQITPHKTIDARVLYTRLPFSSLPMIKTLRGISFDFVQNQKIDILAFEPEEEHRRVVISVDPGSGISLKGLGLALDRKTTEQAHGRRVKISREWRMIDGKRYPDPLFPYQDPWYDGRGFDYTIVDAPSSRTNRYLAVEDIKKVLKSGWYRLAQEYETGKYKEWLSGREIKGEEIKKETDRYKFQDALYTRHFLYPLISLYPMQIDLHWIIALMNRELSGEAEKQFEELAEKRPQWPLESKKETGESPKSSLQYLIDYISAYKAKCQARIKVHNCPFEEECECSSTDKYGWCKRYHYAPTGERGEKLSSQLEVFPSAYEIMNHQLEWLIQLTINTDDELVYLRNVVRESLLRLFMVRDTGKKYETKEISIQDLSLESTLVDHRINRFCDYILEEIEEICLGVHNPFPEIQTRVDNAQMYVKNGMSLLDNLDDSRQELFAPFLANIVTFLEALDRVLHRFNADESESRDIPGDVLFLLILSLEKSKNQSWYQVFRTFILGKIKSEKVKKDPEVFFQSFYWSYTALGPRILGEFYIATINDSYKNFDYFKASLYFRKLKKHFIEPLSFRKKIGLLGSGKYDNLRKLTGLKVEPVNLLHSFINQFRLPFLLNVIFGVGMLIMAEMSYEMWNKHIMNANFPWLVIALLILGSFAGTYSIIPGKKRFRRTVLLFFHLIAAALIPSSLSCFIFPEKFQLTNLSFSFLVFGSVFFAVVVDTFVSRKKK